MKARWTWTALKARWTVLRGWYLRWIKDTATATADTHWDFTKYLPELNTTRWTDYVDPGYWTPEDYAWPGIRTRATVTAGLTTPFSDVTTTSIALSVTPSLPFLAGVPSSYVMADYWTPDEYTLQGIRDSVTATLNP